MSARDYVLSIVHMGTVLFDHGVCARTPSPRRDWCRPVEEFDSEEGQPEKTTDDSTKRLTTHTRCICSIANKEYMSSARDRVPADPWRHRNAAAIDSPMSYTTIGPIGCITQDSNKSGGRCGASSTCPFSPGAAGTEIGREK